MKTPDQWLEIIRQRGATTQPAGSLQLIQQVQDDALRTALLSDGHEEACECLLCHTYKTIITKRDAAMLNGEASEPGTMTHDNPKPEAANPRRNPGSLC